MFGKPFVTLACLNVLRLSWFWRKKGCQMFLDSYSRLNRKTRGERIQVRIGIDLRRVEVQLLAPDQFGLLTSLDDGLEESSKDFQAIALADLAESGMLGERFIQIVVG